MFPKLHQIGRSLVQERIQGQCYTHRHIRELHETGDNQVVVESRPYSQRCLQEFFVPSRIQRTLHHTSMIMHFQIAQIFMRLNLILATYCKYPTTRSLGVFVKC
jgi:hypothetical protein